MIRALCIVSVGLLLCATAASAGDAVGSAFGNLSTADSPGMGVGTFGGAVGIADATSFVGWFGYGLSKYADGRIKLGIISDDGESEIVLGVDAKYQIWSVGDLDPKPFDLAIGGLFEYVDFDYGSVLQVGGFGLGSFPVTLSNGRALTPYGRFNIRMERYNRDVPLAAGGDDTDSELKLGVHGGVAYAVFENTSIYAEFQIDGNDGLFLGLVYRVM